MFLFWIKIFFKLVPYIWPFLREMVIGNKSILVALRDNKKKVFFILLVITSFGLNFVAVPRLVTLSAQYVALDKRYKELLAKVPVMEGSSKNPVVASKEVTIPITPKSTETVPEDDQAPARPKPSSTHKAKKTAEQVKADFDKIRAREAREQANTLY